MSSNLFRKRIRASIADPNLQIALDNNAQRRTTGRLAAFASLPDHKARRQRLHTVKADVVANLDKYLAQFVEHLTANGIIVHRATNADEAIRIFLEIANNLPQRTQSDTKDSLVPRRALRGENILVAKAKSMVSEELNFNHALEAAGIRVVETDLGEYIVQLRGEHPSHIITPAVHLRREQVGELFHEKLGIPYTADIPTLTKTARKVLREVFLTADIGVSGVNVGVAETGTLAIVTNEGNGRMCTTVPPVHVALMGIERLVPNVNDLALVLSLLPRSATGQKLSVYTSIINKPLPGQTRHIILVDNGRSALRTSPLADILLCIRCGACLNACPVFRETSGHAYLGRDGANPPYTGPVGSVVSPGLFGCENFGQLAQASSLCGACKEACPVDIDLPGLLLRVRAGETPDHGREGTGLPAPVKLGLHGFRLAAGTSSMFAVFQTLGGLLSRIYSPRRTYMRIPAWTGWGFSKDFPRLAVRPFRAHWKNIEQVISNQGISNQVISDMDSSCSPRVESLSAMFSKELTALGGHVYPVRAAELPEALTAFLRSKGADRVVVDEMAAKYIKDIPALREADPSVRCGVTGSLCGIAETGSVVLVSGAGETLTASLLTEVHAAILKTSQLLPTVADALSRPEVRAAAAGAIVTGPSRTADIEMALTIGVHGPGEIHVFLIDDL